MKIFMSPREMAENHKKAMNRFLKKTEPIAIEFHRLKQENEDLKYRLDEVTQDALELHKRNKMLKADVDGLEDKIQALYETARGDNKRIGDIILTNTRLHNENAELKNDIVHLVRESRKES